MGTSLVLEPPLKARVGIGTLFVNEITTWVNSVGISGRKGEKAKLGVGKSSSFEVNFLHFSSTHILDWTLNERFSSENAVWDAFRQVYL